MPCSSDASLLGERATKRRVLDAISSAGPLDYLHFACHGRFRWRHPEASGLLMADGEVLHLSEILGRIRLGSETLVVLSACETGIAEYRELPDETYGLALALRAAQRWLRDAIGGELQSLVQQLDPRVRAAGELNADTGSMRIKWVSDDPSSGALGERPFAHPFHWAGFVCIA